MPYVNVIVSVQRARGRKRRRGVGRRENEARERRGRQGREMAGGKRQKETDSTEGAREGKESGKNAKR